MAKTKQQLLTLQRHLEVDPTAGRVLLEGRSAVVAGSPQGVFVAVSCLTLPEDPKPKEPDAPTRVVRVYRVDASSRAELVTEHREPGDLASGSALAVSDQGSVVFSVKGGLRSVRTPGAPVFLENHACPVFDDAGGLCCGVFGASPTVARYGPDGALRSQHAYDFGNLPLEWCPQTDELFGFSGWLGADGRVTPLRGRDWSPGFISGAGVVFSRPVDGSGQTVHVTSEGVETALADAVCAASADGQYVVAIRYPPIEEAHAQRKSQYEARRLELVDLRSGERRDLRAARFPEGKVLAWRRGDAMLLAREGTVCWYDPMRDTPATSTPLGVRAAALGKDALVTAHDVGVRVNGAACSELPANDVELSPDGAHVLTSGAQRVVIVRASGRATELGHQRQASFAGPGHVVTLGLDGGVCLWPLDGGATRPLALPGVRSVAGLADGVLVGFDKRLERLSLDGTVRMTWALSAKSPKSLKAEKLTWAASDGDDVLVLVGRRLFRLGHDGSIVALLTKVEKTLGASGSSSEGPFRQVALGPDGEVAVVASSFVGSWTSVVRCDTRADEMVAWAGRFDPAPLAVDWSGGRLRAVDGFGRLFRLER